ncbi:hypothetical protein FA95DRAFT_490590 [Auriscalpium vulgare]|uniref:Uncharacterized protein n=1 Tax=Auriscalpium vulgare TaxID=40419 RepID=A0ACB8SCX7_9AGAM|nr:hypothetical protein FA95DRAFT_490590 [Auriscalpium vulgare]
MWALAAATATMQRSGPSPQHPATPSTTAPIPLSQPRTPLSPSRTRQAPVPPTQQQRAATTSTAPKRRRNTEISAASKKRQRTDSQNSPPIPGVGPSPSQAPSEVSPGGHSISTSSTYHSLVNPRDDAPHEDKTTAQDVWHNVRPLGADDTPISNWDDATARLSKKPKAARVGCRFGNCKVTWKCDGGVASHIRKHFTTYHYPEYKEITVKHKFKYWERLLSDDTTTSRTDGPQARPTAYRNRVYEQAGFFERLVRWMVVDDQAMNVVDCEDHGAHLREISRRVQENGIGNAEFAGAHFIHHGCLD